MEALGSILGKWLFDPNLLAQRSIVMPVYGVKDCGKTPLLEATEASCRRRVPKVLFKVRDFGKETYPGAAQITFPDDGTVIKLSPPNLTYHYDLPAMDKQSTPGMIYCFEHAPMAPLRRADVGIVISWPGEEGNVGYLRDFSSNIEICAEKFGWNEPQIDCVVQNMREAQEDTAVDWNERIVRIILPTRDKNIEKSFGLIKREIQKAFAPR